MSTRRKRAFQAEGLEARFCLSTIGFDHIVAPHPAGSVAPSTTSLQGDLTGLLDGSSTSRRGVTTSQFAFTGSLADPGPVIATMAITTNRSDALTSAKIALKNSLGTIHLVSHAGDYLGIQQTATSASFGATYHIQGSTGSYAHLRGTGTFVLLATPLTATSAQYQLMLTPTTNQTVGITMN